MGFLHSAGALAVLAMIPLSVAAETLHLADLISEALANNPEVRAAQKRYEAARQRPAQERAMPDPTLSIGYASNGTPLPGGQLGSNPTSNIGFTISQEVPYPGKRRLRGEVALKEAEAEFEQYQAVALNVRARVVQAFHRLHHTYASLEVLVHGKEILNETIRVSEIRYSAGKTTQTDIFKAQLQLSLFETRIIRMRQDLEMAEAELNSLLNRKPGNPLGEPAHESPSEIAMPLDQLLDKATGLAPDLARERKLIERGELSVNLARQEFHTDYTVSAGYFNQGAMSPMYQFRVDVPLRLHTEAKQRPALVEQVDRLSEARRNFEAGNQNLQFRVREAYIAAETAWRLRQLYLDTIIPQAQLAVDSSLTGYQTGSGDLVGVLSNISTKIDAEEQLHEQELRYAQAVARLEELTGVDLTKAGGR